MSVALYLDHHVPAGIAQGLRDRGIDILTAHDDGTEDWSDERLLERARDLERAVFTQDRDFLVLADEWRRSGREFAGVIYAHQLGITIGQAIRNLELISAVLDSADLKNRIEFLPYA